MLSEERRKRRIVLILIPFLTKQTRLLRQKVTGENFLTFSKH